MAVPFGCWVWGSCQFVPGMGVQVVGAEGGGRKKARLRRAVGYGVSNFTVVLPIAQ